MATCQITKRLIDGLKPRASEYFVWDGSLAGFGVRVQTTGAMSYVVKYRAGSGRAAPRHGGSRWRRLAPSRLTRPARWPKKRLALLPMAPIRQPSGPLTSAHPPLQRSRSNSLPSMWRPNVRHRPPDHIAICWSGWRCRNSASARLSKITSAEIQRLHSKNAHTPYQANRLLRVLSSLFTFAGKAHAVPIGFNPCRGIEYFPEEGRERYLTTPELGRSERPSGRPKRSGCPMRWINRSQRPSMRPRKPTAAPSLDRMPPLPFVC